MSGSIDRLREIAERCLSGQPLDEDMSRWLGDSLEKYLSQCAKTIDDAFGLKFPKGGIPWWLEEANRMRDLALQELADLFFPDCSITEKAREIATMAERYAASCWRFERDREEMPGSYAGTVNEYLWLAFKSGAAMPIGERQLRNIIAP